MEKKLLNSLPARRRLAATLGVLGAAAAMAAVVGPSLVQADSIAPVTTGGTGTTGTTGADPNDYTCSGQLRKGTPEAGVSGTQVQYRFSCNGPITGYQIETEPHQITYYDASPVASIDDVPSADNFECQGITPGVAINCVGQSSASGEVITGQFAIQGKLNAEPLVDAILTVTEATAPATTVTSASKTSPVTVAPVVTQYMSGPFDLGRPVNVKHDEFSGDTRLGNTPPIVVLETKTKKGTWITTTEPVNGTKHSVGLTKS
ncbi:MAG TPA: hypothetical protein VHM72_07745 [Solirubrobacteraceae bacterium]|nr:hypothetical protein [Solirubrobacteraceae bacterium]